MPVQAKGKQVNDTKKQHQDSRPAKNNFHNKNEKSNAAASLQLYHWTDVAAENVIREKGDKTSYTVAAGITPSGVVHIGNFREIITVDLVKRALEKRGKKIR